MKTDIAIFGPRPDPGIVVQPSPQELNDFLENSKKDTVAEFHVADVIRYRRPLYHVESFEQRLRTAENHPTAAEALFFSALLHMRFFNRALLLAVGQYKFHFRDLARLDHESLTRFLSSAEITIKRLSKRKIDDMLRMERLRQMIEDRKVMLQRIRMRWDSLTAELLDIAYYVRENLTLLEHLCRRSVSVLTRHGLADAKLARLNENIKMRFKNKLRSAMAIRTVTTTDVAEAKQEVEALIAALAPAVVDDIGRMASLYETVRGYVIRAGGQLDTLLSAVRGEDVVMGEERVLFFRRIEQALVSIIGSYPHELDPANANAPSSGNAIIEEMRWEMVDFLLAEVRKEHRMRSDRRDTKDRRKRNDPLYRGPERRRGGDRRTGGNRRTRS